MARLDIQCATCELIIRDIIIPGGEVNKGKIKKHCPDCKSRTFLVYWGGGEAPSTPTIGSDKEKLFDSCKTIGEFWDKTGVNPTSKEYNKASKAHVEGMRQKAMKNNARKKPNQGS